MQDLLSGGNAFLTGVVLATCAALLVAASTPLSYVLYEALRILVTYAALTVTLSVEQGRFKWIRLPLLAAAITFNPVYPLQFSKEHWIVLDIAVSFLLLGCLYPALLPRLPSDPPPQGPAQRAERILSFVLENLSWLLQTLPLTSLAGFTLGMLAVLGDSDFSIRIRPLVGFLLAIVLIDANEARKAQKRRESDLRE